jgi:hypothetical protein
MERRSRSLVVDREPDFMERKREGFENSFVVILA